MSTPVPDWEKSKLFLVDPAIWPFYTGRTHDLRPVYNELRSALDTLRVDYRVLCRSDHPIDIWIRDWGCIDRCFFEYQPSYARGVYSPSAIRHARKVLASRAGGKFRSMRLVLDGGNLVHNGRVAIVTDKVLDDNPHCSRARIERLLLSMGFERVVFIPTEPDDALGHADGILRFLSENILLVNSYDDPEFSDYRRTLFKRLHEAKLASSVAEFPWRSTHRKAGRLWSAVGNYVNLLVTSKGIVYPVYGNQADAAAESMLRKLSDLPSVPVHATALAQLGGVLNCIVSL